MRPSGWTAVISALKKKDPPWLPQTVRFLHVNQLEEFVPGATILQDVLEADIERVERCVYPLHPFEPSAEPIPRLAYGRLHRSPRSVLQAMNRSSSIRPGSRLRRVSSSRSPDLLHCEDGERRDKREA